MIEEHSVVTPMPKEMRLFATLSESPMLESSLQPKGWSIMEKVHESLTDPIYVGTSHGRVQVRIGNFAPRTASLSRAEARLVAHALIKLTDMPLPSAPKATKRGRA